MSYCDMPISIDSVSNAIHFGELLIMTLRNKNQCCVNYTRIADVIRAVRSYTLNCIIIRRHGKCTC